MNRCYSCRAEQCCNASASVVSRRRAAAVVADTTSRCDGNGETFITTRLSSVDRRERDPVRNDFPFNWKTSRSLGKTNTATRRLSSSRLQLRSRVFFAFFFLYCARAFIWVENARSSFFSFLIKTFRHTLAHGPFSVEHAWRVSFN